MTEQQREAFEQWVVSQFPGHALDEIDPGALDLARSAYEQAALSHAEGEELCYTHDGALAECPCCGSLDVGGAGQTVSCYMCGLTVTKSGPLQNAIDAWNKRSGRTHPAPEAAMPEGWREEIGRAAGLFRQLQRHDETNGLWEPAAVEKDMAERLEKLITAAPAADISQVTAYDHTIPVRTTSSGDEQPVGDPDGMPGGWRSELERIRDLIAGAPKDALGSGVAPACAPWPIRDEVVHKLTQILSAPAPDEREVAVIRQLSEIARNSDYEVEVMHDDYVDITRFETDIAEHIADWLDKQADTRLRAGKGDE